MRRFLSAALLLAACSRKSPDEQLIKQFDSVKSWSATVQFAGEKWRANSVPAFFMRATIAAAEKDYDAAARSIDQSRARKELRDQFRRELDAARASAQRLKHELR
ncbi:MAG: hypothetical protein DMF59_00605 [Acidobacteria bacterium]|nr:MAG: hypothetical protein DMF59_00605 [Acidobacteriota bacterium]